MTFGGGKEYSLKCSLSWKQKKIVVLHFLMMGVLNLISLYLAIDLEPCKLTILREFKGITDCKSRTSGPLPSPSYTFWPELAPSL